MKGQILESVFSPSEKGLAVSLQTAMQVGAYEPPRTVRTVVETEGNFCGSVFGPENHEHDKGLSIEEHGFANPDSPHEIGPTLDAGGQQVGDWEWD